MKEALLTWWRNTDVKNWLLSWWTTKHLPWCNSFSFEWTWTMELPMDQFEEAIQKWKYSNGRTSESWSKVEATAMGSSRQKIELRVEKGTAMILHLLSGWLASSYPIRRAFLQHISKRVSVESVINKRESSCHFALRSGWIFVHPTNTVVTLDLKGFTINQKLFLSSSEYYYYCQWRTWNIPHFWNRHD